MDVSRSTDMALVDLIKTWAEPKLADDERWWQNFHLNPNALDWVSLNNEQQAFYLPYKLCFLIRMCEAFHAIIVNLCSD